SIETANASSPEAGVGQTNAPAIEFQSLLNMRYYERDGGFLVDDLQMVSLRELPAGVSRPLCTIHVMQGGQEIAATRSPVVPSYVDWQFYKTELIQPKGLGGGWLPLAALTKRDGELTIVIKVNGQPVKSYRAEVRGGQPVRLARNQMEFEPHTDFISTRLIDVSRDGGCEYCMLDLFWVKANER
ncbi:MAG TPA: hypothetical protein VI837_13695, partial [Blastocatellia bacterium]|nr:hypothetical protein [Blastocatellia bacterium]